MNSGTEAHGPNTFYYERLYNSGAIGEPVALFWWNGALGGELESLVLNKSSVVTMLDIAKEKSKHRVDAFNLALEAMESLEQGGEEALPQLPGSLLNRTWCDNRSQFGAYDAVRAYAEGGRLKL